MLLTSLCIDLLANDLQNAQNHVVNIIWIACFQICPEIITMSSNFYCKDNLIIRISTYIILSDYFVLCLILSCIILPAAVRSCTDLTLAGPQKCSQVLLKASSSMFVPSLISKLSASDSFFPSTLNSPLLPTVLGANCL